MTELFNPSTPSTPAAATTVAETRDGEGSGAGGDGENGGGAGGGGGTGDGWNGNGGDPRGRRERCADPTNFIIDKGVERATRGRPYERKPGDPLYRPLAIYTLDPTTSALDGATVIVNVPYEPLKPGPAGRVFRVESSRGTPLDLEDPLVLIRSGLPPSPADPQFHKQMVYAVCSLVYAAFRTALGRHVAWGFDPPTETRTRRTRLILEPHIPGLSNALLSRASNTVRFGILKAPEQPTTRTVPNGEVFTCVSHDLIAHELTHALLDGLRAHFQKETSPDVPAFHEAFADVIALLQHFSYPQVVSAAIRRTRGAISQARLITTLARQFGDARGRPDGLRTAVDLATNGTLLSRKYNPKLGRYELGSVLVSAIFDAFLTVYTRKTERYVRLATGGTGTLPRGELPVDLQLVLAEEASQLASQFLNVCIRAIDYCPPVDVQMSEFLRAVITADMDLVPDDPWAYREAWIDAFARHGIIPLDVASMAEVDLRWDPPVRKVRRIRHLSFKRLRFEGDPGRPASRKELRRQACALGECMVENPDVFGMAVPGRHPLTLERLRHAEVDLPRVQSIRASRRVGPDSQVVFDLVAEVTQRCVVHHVGGEEKMEFHGGATVILGPRGDLRYVVYKRTLAEDRMVRQLRFDNDGTLPQTPEEIAEEITEAAANEAAKAAADQAAKAAADQAAKAAADQAAKATDPGPGEADGGPKTPPTA